MNYLGKRSMDSEMFIDLEKGTIKFDYSLNKYQQDLLSSNQSFFDFNNNIDYDVETSLITKIKTFLSIYKLLIIHLLYRYSVTFNRKIKWGGQDIAYVHQEAQINHIITHFGTSEYTFEGRHTSKEIIYHLSSNLWFEYELEGDYRDKVKSIELKRRFVRNIHKFGISDQQDGWNLILNFRGIPMHGKCIIRYL